ncbi:multidrug efflux SMR transporter [Pseudoalteromonas sp.]|jgi:multidrug transporter EmrE-like cation transporter|uniref:DMT family transporter n=1 Tax=Pseudoalteromonas sp. TaxID=53249 RepID=UPI00356AF981
MHWIYLIIAVILEVIGTTVMKWLVDNDHILLGSLFVTLMVGLAYLALSQATSKIPIALANAFWEGLGMVFIASVSIVFLGEAISVGQVFALFLAISGIVIINSGHAMQEQTQ